MNFIDRTLSLLEKIESDINPQDYVIYNYKHQEKFLSIDGKNWLDKNQIEGGGKIKTFKNIESGKKWIEENWSSNPQGKFIVSGTIFDYPSEKMQLITWEDFTV